MDYAIEAEKNVDLSGQKLIRMARLPRLYRLLRTIRLFKVIKLFKRSEMVQKLLAFFRLNSAALRLTTFFISILFFVHLSGCLWIIMASLNDFSPDTWVARLHLTDSEDYEIYMAAIYWSIQTLLTVGYGDISAKTTEEMVMAVCWMIVGGFFYTFTIGNLTSVLSNQNSR
jgi:Ion transport protein